MNVLPVNVPDVMRQVMSGLQPDWPVPVSELDANTYVSTTLPPIGVVMSTLNPSALHVLAPVPWVIVPVASGGDAQPKTLPPKFDVNVNVVGLVTVKTILAEPEEPNVSLRHVPFQLPASVCGVNVGGGGGGGGGGIAVKTAPAFFAAMSLSVQADFAFAHAPVQRVKRQPAFALAVSFTDFPFANAFTHAFGQTMPLGALVTVPCPTTVTVSFTFTDTAADETPASAATATNATATVRRDTMA